MNDHLDLRILRELQADSSRSIPQLAETLYTSPSTLQRRVQKLKADRLIVSEKAEISASASFHKLTAIIELVTSTFNASSKSKLLDFAKQHDNIKSCFVVTGQVQYILIATFRDVDHFYAFTEEHFINSDWVEHFRSFFVVQQVKSDPLVHLFDEEESDSSSAS